MSLIGINIVEVEIALKLSPVAFTSVVWKTRLNVSHGHPLESSSES